MPVSEPYLKHFLYHWHLSRLLHLGLRETIWQLGALTIRQGLLSHQGRRCIPIHRDLPVMHNADISRTWEGDYQTPLQLSKYRLILASTSVWRLVFMFLLYSQDQNENKPNLLFQEIFDEKKASSWLSKCVGWWLIPARDLIRESRLLRQQPWSKPANFFQSFLFVANLPISKKKRCNLSPVLDHFIAKKTAIFR